MEVEVDFVDVVDFDDSDVVVELDEFTRTPPPPAPSIDSLEIDEMMD